MEEYDQQLTLHRTLQICQAYEASHVTEQTLNQDNPPQLLAAQHTTSSYKRNRSTHAPPPAPCQHCSDGHHPRDQCKARNQTFRNRGKRGHLASVCRQKNRLHALQATNLDHPFLRQAHRTADYLVAIQTQIDGTGVDDTRWLPDSGADIDAMSAKDLATVDPNLLKNLAPEHYAVRAVNGPSHGATLWWWSRRRPPQNHGSQWISPASTNTCNVLPIPPECQARSSPASHQACGILPRWTRGTATGRSPWAKKGEPTVSGDTSGAHLSWGRAQPARRRGTRRH